MPRARPSGKSLPGAGELGRQPSMGFPVHRPRRLRSSEALRGLVRETTLAPSDFVYPLFVMEGRGERRPIASMPGIFNLTVDAAVTEAKAARALGIPALILFGLPEFKDPAGTEAYAEGGIVQRALRTLKEAVPELLLIADVCLCEYTDHGHCGVVADGKVQNDATLPLLARMAVSCLSRERFCVHKKIVAMANAIPTGARTAAHQCPKNPCERSFSPGVCLAGSFAIRGAT